MVDEAGRVRRMVRSSGVMVGLSLVPPVGSNVAVSGAFGA